MLTFKRMAAVLILFLAMLVPTGVHAQSGLTLAQAKQMVVDLLNSNGYHYTVDFVKTQQFPSIHVTGTTDEVIQYGCLPLKRDTIFLFKMNYRFTDPYGVVTHVDNTYGFCKNAIGEFVLKTLAMKEITPP